MTNLRLSSLRTAVDDRLRSSGQPGSTRREWEGLLDEGTHWVQSQHPDDLADLIDRSRRKRTGTQIPDARVLGSVEPSEDLRRWAWGRSLLAAEEAGGLSEVVEFRETHLLRGELLQPSEIPGWIEGQPTGVPAMRKVVISDGRKPFRCNPDDKVLSVEYLVVCYESGAGEPRSVVPALDSPLLELALLAEKLERRYHWYPSDGTSFVLAGTTPWTVLLRSSAGTRIEDRGDDLVSVVGPADRISLTADADVPLDLVVGEYVARRAEARGQTVRRPSTVGVELAIHSLESASDSTHAQMASWNRDHPESAYADERAFRQATRDARRRLAGVNRSTGAVVDSPIRLT
ncbi:MAG: hypothetical protein Q7V88_09135 [Actinomycetota bacterium]|nr:hypothetical protein [Actinomycetota bacterium]